MRIDAYRNLNKKECVMYSIRHQGKVITYRPFVLLTDVTFKHATPKQLTAVRTGARQVCQWVKGEWADEHRVVDVSPTPDYRRMLVDPKKADGFVDAETGQQLKSALIVKLCAEGSAYYATRTV